MNLLVNRREKRLRAMWRILIQSFLYLVTILIAGVGLAGLALVALLPTGSPNLWLQSEAETLASILYETIAGNPILIALSGFLNLLAVLFTVGVAARLLDHRSLRDLGFHFRAQWWEDWVFGLVLGASLMVLVFESELALGWITVTGFMQAQGSNLPFGVSLASGFVLFFFVGIYEEVISRGYLLRNMAEGLNLRLIGPRGAVLAGWLLSSLLFGLLHQGNANALPWVTTINLALAGLALGLGFILTGELAISIGFHMSWNMCQGLVFGFPVSGAAASAALISIRQAGPAEWTGGAFGPEGGLTGILALVAGSLAILAWVRWTRGHLSILDLLAVYGLPSPGSRS